MHFIAVWPREHCTYSAASLSTGPRSQQPDSLELHGNPNSSAIQSCQWFIISPFKHNILITVYTRYSLAYTRPMLRRGNLRQTRMSPSKRSAIGDSSPIMMFLRLSGANRNSSHYLVLFHMPPCLSHNLLLKLGSRVLLWQKSAEFRYDNS
jgi:hypothetical protein